MAWFCGLIAYKLCESFDTKTIHVDKQQWYYLTHSLGDKQGVNTFPWGISPEVNIVV